MSQDFLPPDYQQEIDAATRRKMLAQAFLQQGLSEEPQGRMVSGHYVRTNPTQHLSRIAKILAGQHMGGKADQEIGAARRRFSQDQSDELGKIQGMAAGSPGGPTPNFVMQPDEDGTPEMAHTPAVAGDPLGAEQAAQRSQFGSVQALGKAMMENRQKRLAEMQKEMAGRVSVQDVPRVYSGQTEGLQAKQGIQYVDGIPVATPSEYTPGGPAPQRIGPGYSEQVTQGPSGPMLTQQNPTTGKKDTIDKTPRTTVNVGGESTEDTYWKKVMSSLGETDAARVQAGRDAPTTIASISRIREMHINSNGQYTGGPVAGPVRFLRDLASQAGVPISPETDLNNVKMQAEFAQKVAQAIIGQGRGLTNEDRKALEQSFPTAALTPAQMPAFLTQYERIVRENAAFSDNVLKQMQKGRGRQAPTALRDNPPLPTNNEEVNKIRKKHGLPPL